MFHPPTVSNSVRFSAGAHPLNVQILGISWHNRYGGNTFPAAEQQPSTDISDLPDPLLAVTTLEPFLVRTKLAAGSVLNPVSSQLNTCSALTMLYLLKVSSAHVNHFSPTSNVKFFIRCMDMCLDFLVTTSGWWAKKPQGLAFLLFCQQLGSHQPSYKHSPF